MTNNSDSRIVVAFHVGRGGQFHNPGHKTYKGEINFAQLCNSQNQYLYEVNRDSNGRFCRPYLIDAGGSTAVTPDDYGKDVGVINYDFEYDKWICCYIDECDDSELMMIYQAGETWTDAFDFAKNKLSEDGMINDAHEVDELIDSIANFGGDPYLVETDEQAQELLESIKSTASLRKIVRGDEDFEMYMKRLDLTDENRPAAIYSGVDGSEFCFIYANDYIIR